MDARPLRIILSRRGELLTFDRGAGGFRLATLATAAANAGVPEGGDEVVVGDPARPAMQAPPLRVERGEGDEFVTLPDSGFGESGETFLLADSRLLTGLRDLAGGTWLRDAPLAADPAADVPFLRGLTWPGEFVAELGGVRIDVAASRELLAEPADPDAPFIIDPLTRVERLLRFDPVVAYTAFGPTMALFRCLEASLYPLSRVAGFTGRVLILSDRERTQVEFLVPGELRPRTQFVQLEAATVMAMATARYRLPEIPVAMLARPLLYIDTDIVFDRPIERLLAEVLLSRRLCVFAEDELLHPMDFYGRKLFEADPEFTPRHQRGFSTGVIGMADVADAAGPFRALLALIEAHGVRTGDRGSNVFDQRFANYLFHKLVEYNDTIVNRYETYCNNREPDPARRLGMAHFAGGIGLAEPKLARMQAYLTALQQADAGNA